MKRKYYLRGIGIGILFTTLVLVFVYNGKQMSDEDVIAKAKELGLMTEEEFKEKKIASLVSDAAKDETDPADLTSGTDEPEKEEEKNSAGSGDQNQENTEDSDKPAEDGQAQDGQDSQDGTDGQGSQGTEDNQDGQDNQDSQESGKNSDEEPIKSTEKEPDKEPEKEPDAAEDYVLTISRGMTSESVSRTLAADKVIESADEFNRFLIQIGRQDQLQVGTYSIPAGATQQEIADIIAK